MSKLLSALYVVTLFVVSTGPIALPQTAPTVAKPAPEAPVLMPPATRPIRPDTSLWTERTFYLNNTVQQSEANEILTAIRNILPPETKIYLVASENAIVIRASAEDFTLIQKLLNDLDRPRKTYRLTYTVTEIEGVKRVGTQHFAVVIVSGQETKLKQGSRVPIATGSYNASATTGTNAAPAGVQTQFTYLDIGMNFSSTVQEMGANGRLRFNVEQSSLAPETSGVGPQDPIVRQTSLTGEATLAPGKPMMLGSVDIPGSTRHLDIEVLMEPLP